ncbi:pilin glycosylation ligase domain-containing protein [Piscinibacter sp.]
MGRRQPDAASSLADRAVGNLRQPNHLSSLLLWGIGRGGVI